MEQVSNSLRSSFSPCEIFLMLCWRSLKSDSESICEKARCVAVCARIDILLHAMQGLRFSTVVTIYGIRLRMALNTQIPSECSETTQDTIVTAGARAGLISTPTFANGSAGAEYVASNGEWLNVPDAVLFSNSGSNNQAILLSLQNPLYNEDDKVRTSAPFPLLIHLKCHWASL
jgi:hypothetical protein